MSSVNEYEGSMLLRKGEREMLERARRGAPWPGSQVAPIIERLGRARMAHSKEGHWRTAYDELAEGFADLHERAERDQRRFDSESRRLRRERDDAQQAARNADAMRLVVQRRTGEIE